MGTQLDAVEQFLLSLGFFVAGVDTTPRRSTHHIALLAFRLGGNSWNEHTAPFGAAAHDELHLVSIVHAINWPETVPLVQPLAMNMLGRFAHIAPSDRRALLRRALVSGTAWTQTGIVVRHTIVSAAPPLGLLSRWLPLSTVYDHATENGDVPSADIAPLFLIGTS